MKLTSFFKNSVWAFTDKGFQALFGVFLAIYILRELPSDEAALFINLQVIFLTFSNIVHGMALGPMVKFYSEDTTKHNFVAASFALNLIGFVAGSILLVIFTPFLSSILQLPKLSDLMYLAIIISFFSLLKNFVSEIYRAKNVIWIYSLTNIIQQLSSLVALLWISFRFGLESAEQVAFVILGGVFTCLTVTFFILLFRGSFKAINEMSLNFSEEIKKIWNFGKYTSLSITLQHIYDKVDILMITSLLGIQEVVLYYAVINFKKVYDLMKQIIHILFFPTMCKLWFENKIEELRAFSEKIIFSTTLVLIIGSIFLFFSADFLFEILYKNKFPEGANMLRIFTFYALILSSNTTGEALLLALNKPKKLLAVRVFSSILNVVMNYILILEFGVLGAILSTLLSISIVSIIYAYESKKEIGFTFYGVLGRYNDLINLLKNRF